MGVYLTRRERFAAAHRLWLPSLSDQENEDRFGICSNYNGHGHNYELFVTLYGEPNTQTGLLIDLKDMKKVIREKVTDVFDHKHLDLDTPYFKDKTSSIENICVVVWELLLPNFGDLLWEVKIVETENNSAFYRG